MVTVEENAAASHGDVSPVHPGEPETDGLDALLRTLPGFRDVMQAIREVAVVDVPVLIEGEPGTGIDFAAHEIHRLSPRCNQLFIAVSCAGVSESSLASQFWGSERRAVGEQEVAHPGLFEQADGGTVFFEEVRDIPPGLQVQLARMIRTREIPRIGQTRPRKLDARLVCATKFNLVHEAAEGSFSSDLLYKVRVAQIRVPPLRERLMDISELATFYLRQCRLKPDTRLPGMSDEVTGILLGHTWPGNMTELQSAIEFAALRCAGSMITAADLPREILASQTTGSWPAVGPGQTERDRFEAAMAAANGNRTLAARMLGISRATLYRRLKELGIPTRA